MKSRSNFRSSDPTPLLLIMPSFRGGGAERVFITLAISLHEGPFSASMAVISSEGPYAEEVPAEIVVHNLSRRRAILSLPQIIRLLNSSAPSVVLSCMTHLNVVVTLAVYLSKVKHRLVLTEHNPYSLEKASVSWPKRLVLDKLVTRSYKLADCIVAVSQGVKHDLVRTLSIPPDRVTVIHNPIDIRAVLAASELSASELVNFAQYTDRDLIVSIGRLVQQKRFDLLIDAFAVVHRSNPNSCLVIIGEGSEEENLRAQATNLGLSESVIFTGFVKRPSAILSYARVFALASDYEGFGNVLVEALALGLPIVATDCPSGPREILEDGKYGELVPPGDSMSLANAITMSLAIRKSAKEAHELRQRAWEFDTTIAIGHYSNLLRGLRFDWNRKL